MSTEIGELVRDLFAAKQTKANLNEEITKLNEDIRRIEIELLKTMSEQDLYQVKTNDGAVYRAQQVVPKVVNWDEFYKYIAREKAFHMLERRPTRTAFRELYELGQHVPGVEAVVFDEVRTRRS